MSATRVLGIVLLVVGVILIVIGVSGSDSVADTVSSAFTGRLTRNTLWFIIGGSVSSLVGLLLTVGVLGRSRR